MNANQLAFKAMQAVNGCTYIYESQIDGILDSCIRGHDVVSPEILAEAKLKFREALRATSY